jgi:DNA-binding CsgD family transcriptional regulator
MTGTLNEAPPELTDRQRQVIELIARGCSNEEVGLRLGISPKKYAKRRIGEYDVRA